jgi:hypothetical protein
MQHFSKTVTESNKGRILQFNIALQTAGLISHNDTLENLEVAESNILMHEKINELSLHAQK